MVSSLSKTWQRNELTWVKRSCPQLFLETTWFKVASVGTSKIFLLRKRFFTSALTMFTPLISIAENLRVCGTLGPVGTYVSACCKTLTPTSGYQKGPRVTTEHVSIIDGTTMSLWVHYALFELEIGKDCVPLRCLKDSGRVRVAAKPEIGLLMWAIRVRPLCELIWRIRRCETRMRWAGLYR